MISLDFDVNKNTQTWENMYTVGIWLNVTKFENEDIFIRISYSKGKKCGKEIYHQDRDD
jgi:hypothetical protein